MRKFLVCLLACLMFVNSSIISVVIAETIKINDDFSIRNGITAHSTIHDVETVESANKSKSGAQFSDYVMREKLAYTVTLAGLDVELFYWVDSKGYVQQFQYILNSDDEMTKVRASLINKYGQPNYNYEDWATLNTEAFSISTGQMGILSPSLTAYDGWMLEYNDCWVLVENCKIKFAGIGTMGVLNYYIMSPEEVQAHLVVQGAIEDSIQQSVNSDL